MDGFWFQRKSEPYQKAHYVSSKGDLDGHEWRRFEESRPIQGWNCRAWIKSKSLEGDWPAGDSLANHFSLLVLSERLAARYCSLTQGVSTALAAKSRLESHYWRGARQRRQKAGGMLSSFRPRRCRTGRVSFSKENQAA
jgi:hypothetical protein